MNQTNLEVAQGAGQRADRGVSLEEPAEVLEEGARSLVGPARGEVPAAPVPQEEGAGAGWA